MFVFLVVTTKKNPIPVAASFALIAMLLYVPAGYYFELMLYRRRMRRKTAGPTQPPRGKEGGQVSAELDVRMFTVGQLQENCYVVRRPNATRAVIVDPGEEADRLLGALEALGVQTLEAILLTHTHFDHIGAVAAVARATGAPVYCPELETEVLANINDYVRFPGFGPFESYEADHTVAGGETLQLAGIDFEVVFTPGHSPGHVTYAVREAQALFSGDVLFEGSVGPRRSARRRLADAAGLDRHVDQHVSRAEHGVPGAHGRDHAGARAGDQPVPARARAVLMIQVPKGTYDVLPQDAARREALEGHAERILEAAGYRRIETPTFEATELFARGVGEATDIVQKEMYSFDDGGGRSLTLRPEGTAPVCRAYIEHGMHKLAQPVKFWYLSSFYRAEAPQRGRYRQFWQVGAEAIGSSAPATDAELIVLLADLLHAVGVKARLRLASLGSPETRAAYRDQLDRTTCARTATSSRPRSARASSSTRCGLLTPASGARAR